MDEQLPKMFLRSSVDSLKKRLQERNFDKFYTFDKCLQVLSGEIRRYHRGGMSVEEIVDAVNADFSLVSKSDVIKVLTQKEPPAPRKARKKRRKEAVPAASEAVSEPISDEKRPFEAVRRPQAPATGAGSGRFEMRDYKTENL